MNRIVAFLNANSGALGALFSGVVALSTVIYAILTWRLVRESMATRALQTQPKVVLTYRSREEFISLLDIVVKNIGLGPAYEISFEIHPVVDGPGSQALMGQLKQLNFLQKGLGFLAPGQEMRSFLASFIDQFEEKVEVQLSYRVIYNNVHGKTFRDSGLLDFSELRGLRGSGQPPLYRAAKQLEEIVKILRSVSSGFGRLKTDVFTAEDRRRVAKEVDNHPGQDGDIQAEPDSIS